MKKMKEQKQLSTGLTEQSPTAATPSEDKPEDKSSDQAVPTKGGPRFGPTGVKVLRPESMTNSDGHPRRSRGRLNRETLAKLGKTLEAYYDDVRKQGVPDRFKDLLRQYEERNDKGSC
jgi:Anti-sigma factor NepR